jgi:hypothetical protein
MDEGIFAVACFIAGLVLGCLITVVGMCICG